MKTHFEVAVIGGGIIGCSIAYYLAKEKIDVAVFEQQQIASKTTSAAAGMLGAHSECDDLEVFYPFARNSQLTYFKLQQEMKELCGIDIEMKKGGIFQLVYSDAEKQALHSTLSFPTVRWYERDEVKKYEAAITPNILERLISKTMSTSYRLPYAKLFVKVRKYWVHPYLSIPLFLTFVSRTIFLPSKHQKENLKLNMSSWRMAFGVHHFLTNSICTKGLHRSKENA